MSRIDDLIAEKCPSGIKHATLGEVGLFVRGNGLQKKDLKDSGFGCVHYGQVHTQYGTQASITKSFVTNELARRLRKAQPDDLIIATTSEDDEGVCKAMAWMGTSAVAVSGDCYVYRHSLNPLFMAYFFQTNSFREQKMRFITGTKVKRVSGKDLARIRLPVPPSEIQSEIVSILVRMEQLEAELEAELEARQLQYAHYRYSLLAFPEELGVRWSTLGEISARVSSGATPLAGNPEYYEAGTIPWLRTQEVRFVDIWDTDIRITEKALKRTAVKWIPANCVIVAISGATAGRSAVNRIPLATNQHCCNFEIDPIQANFRYVFHWVRSQYEQIKALGQGARSDLNAGIIKSVRIPVPPLAEQERIASILDKFDTLVNDLSIGLPAELKARRRQYEYYRDKLLTFAEIAV